MNDENREQPFDDDEQHEGGFTPFTAQEREELTEGVFLSPGGQRLQVHLLARATLAELKNVDPREIDRGIAESPDAGVEMASEHWVSLTDERQKVLLEAVRAHSRNAIKQAVRQFEYGANQLKIDPRLAPPELLALFAATPAILGGVLFKLEDDPD